MDNQLPLNLNTEATETEQYNGWTLMLTKERKQKVNDYYQATQRSGQQFFTGTTEINLWTCHIHKPGHKHDGACIVADAHSKSEAIARTQDWIDWACK